MAVSDRLRLTVVGPEEVAFDIGPEELDVEASRDTDGQYRRPPSLTSIRRLDAGPAARAAGQSRYEVLIDGWRFEVSAEPADRAALRDRARRGGAADRSHDRLAVRAQIPGRVVRVWVSPGDAVEHGQRLLAIEAMKMENEVRAPRSGIVAAVRVVLGATVELRDELVTLD
jgi:biotin carboxyl carrier protein